MNARIPRNRRKKFAAILKQCHNYTVHVMCLSHCVKYIQLDIDVQSKSRYKTVGVREGWEGRAPTFHLLRATNDLRLSRLILEDRR